MHIGIPKEIKDHEYRIGATPAMVRALVESGHEVIIETMAGEAIGFSDELFKIAGALIAQSQEEVWNAEMIIKVKEPQKEEYSLIKEGQILFTYLHLAPDPEQTEHLVKSKCIAIAYETVTDKWGRLPLLIPMSEIAGRISVQAGATALQLNNGGKGLLLGGVPGVEAASVVVIGGGIVGTESARMAMGFGAEVTILDNNLNRLRELDQLYGPLLRTVYSTTSSIEEATSRADLVIGAVLIPGKTAPKLINRKMLKNMCPKSVLVDVAIDQGGISETSRPTTHTEPTYLEEGVLHYCVTNMPGACARTSTEALTNATMSYVLEIAQKGLKKALEENQGLQDGVNICYGQVTNEHVAHDLGYPYVALSEAIRGQIA